MTTHLTEEEYLARMRRATVKLKQLETQLATAERARTEPIAIIGMACRFPGGASTPESFWDLLRSGVDAVTKVPPERWPEDPYGRGEASSAEERSTRWGAFLKEPVDQFDPHLFGISPREAASLDPQQRLLLEVTWEALERAGQVPEKLVGSKSGVFVGINTNDYEQLGMSQDPGTLSVYDFTGNGHCFPAGRLSYTFGFQGPSMAVDTACSSSLVAVHLACQALRNQECTMAVAGGVNLMLLPWVTHLLSTSQALSADGRCKTFDARANGYVRGEGCGIVVLKRLSEALADGDTILAQIRGSAVNQDGRSTGLAAPNVLAQQAMLRQALQSARVAPEDITYVETHGTGTSLGDPIEFEALTEVVGKPRPDGSRCVLGAVKTNIGHLEAGAGIAGLIKAVLCLQNQAIPGNLHFQQLNPRIALEGTPFVIPTETVAWPAGDKPRVAGISGFGMSGTNAHLILEEAPRRPDAEAAAEAAQPEPLHVLPLSARTAEGVVDLARAYRSYLHTYQAAEANNPAWRLGDVAYTASVRRNHHKQRLAVVGRSVQELDAALDSVIRADPRPGVALGTAPTGATSKVVFVCPGQGSQWEGMARQLLAREAVFRQALEACDAAIQKEAGFSVLAVVRGEGEPLERIDVIQPTLFAIAVALAAQWRSWGVEPDAVVGHSMGEVAAAHIAGVLSLEDAARVICRRSRLLRRVSGQGAMAVVELSMTEAEAALAGYEDRLSVAVSNSLRSTVLSGDIAALDAVLAQLEKKGVFCRRVKVDVASHSPQMDPLRTDLLAALAEVRPQQAQLAMHSTVTCTRVTGPELDAGYWERNLRQPVLFAKVVGQLLSEGHTLFVELSPHPILLPAIEEAMREGGHTAEHTAALPSLRREQDDQRVLLESLAAVYAHGGPVDWTQLYPQGRSLSLPTYPFQRRRYWFEPPASAASAMTPGIPVVRPRVAAGTGPSHPLIGARVPVSMNTGVHIFEQTLDASVAPYLVDHCVQGEIVVPAAAYTEMALFAAMNLWRGRAYVVEPIDFELMMSLSGNAAHHVQLVLKEDGEGEAAFQVSTLQKATGSWVRHAYGRVHVESEIDENALPRETPEALRQRCPKVVPVDDNYQLLRQQGLEYGPCFQGIQEIWQGDEEVLGRVVLIDQPETAVAVDSYTLHPALLDSCFQVLGVLLFAPEKGAPPGQQETYVAVGLEQVKVLGRLPREVWVHGQLRHRPQDGPGRRAGDVIIMDDNGQVLTVVRGLQAQRLEPASGRRPFGEEWLYELTWQQREHLPALNSAAPAPAAQDQGSWLLLVDQRDKTGIGLASRLQTLGQRCIRVIRGQRYRKLEPDLYEVSATEPDSFRALLRDVFAEGSACRGVVHMWSLDATAPDQTTPDTLLADQNLGVISALHLVQALVQHGWRDAPRLWLVTRGAKEAGAGTHGLSISQAPLWGLGLVLVMEHPELQCTRLDLDTTSSQEETETLACELLTGDGEDQVALRPDGRHVLRLVRTTYQSPQAGDDAGQRKLPIDPEATYLITGGLGGLGLAAATWMVAQGARHLVFMGRRAPSEPVREALAAMQAEGVEVVVAQGDVSRYEDVARVIADIDARMPPLRGVIHAAGILDDATVLTLDASRFHNAMAPKMLGAWNLHALTANKPLDLFVLYSSFSSLGGSPGQANYVAANMFLDALAHHRARLGLPVVSINWGPFSTVGLAAAQANRGERLSYRGVGSLTAEQGVAVLHSLVRERFTQVGVVPLDVRQWLDFYPSAAGSPMWSRLLEEAGREQAGAGKASPLRDELAQARPGDRIAVLEKYLTEQIGRVLRLDNPQIDRMETFTNMGMDSLMSIELRNRLEADLGMKLSATLMFTYPNLASLSEYLLDKILAAGAAAAAPAADAEAATVYEPAAAAQAVLPDNLDELEGDELLKLFDDALDESLKRIQRR